jgi:hypothetical protein
MSSEARVLSTATRNSSKSSVALTHVPVAPAAGFKRCCLAGKRFDGSMRADYYRE